MSNRYPMINGKHIFGWKELFITAVKHWQFHIAMLLYDIIWKYRKWWQWTNQKTTGKCSIRHLGACFIWSDRSNGETSTGHMMIFSALLNKNIARLQNCPDIAILLSFCLSVFLSFCLSVFLSFCLSVFLFFFFLFV